LFDSVASGVNYPELELRIIGFWNEHDIFAKSIAKDAPLGRYVFFEGPPTANGLPGVHHVISRAYKDLFPRFKTMQGHRVLRKGGWDTHGLPVEIAIEKRLGFTSKAQIEEFGIARFNELCREYVFENIADWNRMTERIGFWLDLDDAYVTYDRSYIESCWWIMKELWDRGLLAEDYRTTWHSPSSNTTLASHEVALDYRDDVPDPSVFPKFPADLAGLRAAGVLPAGEDRPVFYLAWTTTPWTLAANSGLAVNPDADYALVAAGSEYGNGGLEDLYIVAAGLVGQVFADTPHEVLKTFPALLLQDQKYEPLLQGRPGEGQDLSGAWRVVLDDFVTLDDGTGLVHIAPSYGDLEQGRTHNLPAIFSVGLDGLVLPQVNAPGAAQPGPYTGMWFKDADDRITADLRARNLMFRSGTILHSYPFNWRDGTPLMNVAKKSWYIRTTEVRDRLLANNAKINWHPEHIGEGRFGRWLENNVDWALSRERFWGATMPIWESESGARICVGSVAELEQFTGRDHSELDLHRPYIDEITFEHDGELFTRVPYTIDVWFESGAMPYAQWSYRGDASPDEVKRQLAANFPADYICEAIDQTRGWFYSLHALATLLTDTGDEGREAGPLAELAPDSPAFRNVIVLGHIVDDNGEKMSKSKGNVIDPWEVLDVQGADVLRWYLYSSSPPGATKRFSIALVEETLRDFFNTLWSTYYFFVLYANLDQPDLGAAPAPADRPLTDQWLLARLHSLIILVTERLEDYDSTGASRAIRDFVVDDLSNWYVRRNRRRFWKGGQGPDKLAAYASLHEALVTVSKLIAPLAPFISEELYRNLVVNLDADAPESVHLSSWPVADAALVNHDLLHGMGVLQRIVELGRAARAESGVKTRQPLPELLVRVRNDAEQAGLSALEADLLDELNVKKVSYLDVAADFIDYSVRPNLPLIGRRVGKLIPELRRVLQQVDGREIARNVREGRETTLELAGEEFTFEPEAFLLDARSPEGYAAAEDRGYLAALDTQLTPELIREGHARDLIRLIQNARRNAGLEVSDKIDLRLEAGPELAAAIEAYGETIKAEVLAVQLARHAPGPAPAWHSESLEVEGLPVTVSLTVAPA
jgi:isoleucyl-tRNA synthetase